MKGPTMPFQDRIARCRPARSPALSLGLALAITLPLAPGAHAQGSAAPAAAPGAAASAATSDGEVRKVDKAQGKVTLKHGPIAHLDMPAMTMVFKVSDPRLLDGLNQGDKVRFTAESVKGAVTVTAIQAVR